MDPIFWVKFNQCWAQSLDLPGPGPKMIGPSAPQLKLAVACDLKRLLMLNVKLKTFHTQGYGSISEASQYSKFILAGLQKRRVAASSCY